MMAVSSQDLVGRGVYAVDGSRMGTIKELIGDGDFAVVRRLLSTLVAPVGVLEWSGDRLVIPHTSSYLDMAPKIDTKHPLSAQDRALLERFYMPHAA
ncbi:MAG TPA: PRC-barrel domain-containing protein [Thermoleophilia bacterium]|nr:PRC-barrel domain-containing protein [Thermoleophilia bacterium]